MFSEEMLLFLCSNNDMRAGIFQLKIWIFVDRNLSVNNARQSMVWTAHKIPNMKFWIVFMDIRS